MSPRPSLHLVLPLCAGLFVSPGCDKKTEESADPAAIPAIPSSPSSSASRSSDRSARMPAIELPSAVPVEAAGVMVVRTPESLFATVANFDLLGEPEASDTKALREEIDKYLQSRIGVTLTDVGLVTVFFAPKAGVAAVVEGTEGELTGRSVGEHEGQTLYTLGKGGGEDAVATRHDGLLIVGQREAVQLALSAAAGKGTSLAEAKGPLYELLIEGSKGATLIAAAEVKGLPREVRREAEGVGIERAALHYSGEGITATVMGSSSRLEVLTTQVDAGLKMLVTTAEREKERALEGGDTLEGVGAIYAHHSAKRLQKMLVPTLDGDRLSFEVPLHMADPTLLTAVAGVGAAIAIPAFTKYMRRSKTAEARVQLAKMFDAASSYFNEEHVTRSAVSIIGMGGALPEVAPHGCPNDGRLEGHAGVTPPLSVDCSQGPGGRCVPVEGAPSGPGEYSMKAWTENSVWNGLNFQQEVGHAFHYDFRWANDATGFGACQFTAQAFGDLDGDGVFSTYERAGAADENGVNAAAGIYIAQELE